MKCKKCKKVINQNDNFCQKCGTKINKKKPVKNKKSLNSTKNPISIWDKFVDIMEAEGQKESDYLSLTSSQIWEMFNNIAHNTFESYIIEKKEYLNELPYKSIELIKSSFLWSLYGGYRIYLAELLISHKLPKLINIDYDKLASEWKKLLNQDFYKEINQESDIAISRYSNFRFENLLEIIPELKELPNKIIEELKNKIAYIVIWGYVAGMAENKFR